MYVNWVGTVLCSFVRLFYIVNTLPIQPLQVPQKTFNILNGFYFSPVGLSKTYKHQFWLQDYNVCYTICNKMRNLIGTRQHTYFEILKIK